MQQLQSSYGGDRSDTLAQIFGLDYDPQGQMAAMAQQMLSTGMGSSTAIKTRAMQDDAQLNREFLARQYSANAERRSRRYGLEDEARKRAMQLEDMATARSQKLEDMGMARGYQLEDIMAKELSAIAGESRLEKRTVAAEARKRKGDILDLKSKTLGEQLGMLFNIEEAINFLPETEQTRGQLAALKKARERLKVTTLFGAMSENDPVAQAAAMAVISKMGLIEPHAIAAASEIKGGKKKTESKEEKNADLTPEQQAVLNFAERYRTIR